MPDQDEGPHRRWRDQAHRANDPTWRILGRRAAFVARAWAGWHWRIWSGVFVFLFAPFVDHWSGLSLTRFMAISLTALVWHALEHGEAHVITGNMVWMAALAVATAFGQKTFQMFLQRGTFSAAETTTVDVAKLAEIAARRVVKDGQGVDPA